MCSCDEYVWMTGAFLGVVRVVLNWRISGVCECACACVYVCIWACVVHVCASEGSTLVCVHVLGITLLGSKSSSVSLLLLLLTSKSESEKKGR